MNRVKLGFVFACVFCMALVLGGCGGGGGGSVVTSQAAWTIGMSNIPANGFGTGGVGEYTITVSNNGSGASSGTVTVADTLPSGLTASGMSASGSGFTCTVASVSCTSSSAIQAGSGATITLTVNVAQNAPASVMNQATISGGGASSATANDTTPVGANGSKINHVVIIFQENRTPDNLFHDQNLINAGANIASTGQTSSGPVTLTPVPLVTTYDLGHSHTAFLNSCNWNGSACAMNGADTEPCSGTGCPAQDAAYQYVQASDVQPYFTMAETYAFGDMMFQTNEGPSFPAHQYILSGTSGITATGTTYVADNPSNNLRADGLGWAGCLAPPASNLKTIDISQPFPNSNLPNITGTLSECFEHPTLTDVLDSAGLTWKYYAALSGDIWTAPNAIQHMCDPKSADGNYDDTVCDASDWTAANPNVVIEGSGAQVVTDIGSGQLAAVTWVIPDGASSDHASGNTGLGPSWVASVVNAIGNSAFWNDTAIIISWDDWGGWYDHVPPPIRNGNSYEYGFRVPLIVISPYAKAAYISHAPEDFGSILRFVEDTFALPQIDPAVGYADSYALGDLSDCFNFDQAPLKFTTIQSNYDAKYFINSKRKPTPADND